MSEELYREYILHLYKHPKNFGMPDGCTHTLQGHQPSCGDMFEIGLVITDAKITAAGFTGSGCAVSTASFSLFIDSILGKEISGVLDMSADELEESLGVSISLGRKKCAHLPLTTVKQLTKEL